MRDLANQGDLVAVVGRLHLHPLDQAPQDRYRLVVQRWVLQRISEAADLVAVDLGQVGVQPNRRGRRRLQFGDQVGLLGFEGIELGLQARRPEPVGDRVDQSGELAFDLGQLLLLSGAQPFLAIAPPVDLGMHLPDERLDQLGRHELVLETVEDDVLEVCPRDAAPVGAGALPAGVAAGEVVLADAREVATAGVADHQPGQQVLRPALGPERALARLAVAR